MIRKNTYFLMGALLSATAILTGCASPTAVHIYGKYLENEDRNQLQEKLLALGYDVQINELDVPVDVQNNSVLYSLMLKDNKAVEQITDVAQQSGFKVTSHLPLTRSNHWYTKDSVALILFPESASSERFYAQDLQVTFKSSGCEQNYTMEFNADGSYQLSGYDWSEEEQRYLSGNWFYRQYPYVELKFKEGGHSHTYFEIKTSNEQDQISKIDYIRLTSLNPSMFLFDCVLENGQRRS